MKSETSFKLKSLPIVIGMALGTVMSPVATADEAVEDRKVEKIQVIGSHIKRTDSEGPSPVEIFDREEIDKSGYNNLQQFLQRLPSVGAGTFSTEGNSQDSSANGTAAVSLRGFGADATLVLINGRRVSISSFAESIVNNFVDLNSIPMAAIEEIQILKDGASAIYGSDAVAGVVNVVLRKDFVGSQVNVRYGNTGDTDADEQSINAIFGIGGDDSNATVIFEHFSNSALTNADRGSLGSANQSAKGGMDFRSSRGFPGNYTVTNGAGEKALVRDPGCPTDRIAGNFCVFDYGPFGLLRPRSERTGAMLLFNQGFDNSITAFGEVSMQRNTSEAGGAPTPLDAEAGLSVPVSHPNNPFPDATEILINRHRTVDAGPRRWDIESDTMRLVLGLNGYFDSWDWELSAQKSRSTALQLGNRSQGWVRTDLLQQQIDAGLYNPFGGTVNPQEVIDQVTTNLTRKGESRLMAFEGKITGEIGQLESGPLGMAAGIEYREEEVSDVPDDQFQRGLIFGTESVSARGERDHWSAYIEFSVPLTETLELQFAGRHDDYSDFGTSTNPKIAAMWSASEDLSVRASWGKGFRAPSLAQIGLGPSQDSRFFEDTYLPSAAATDYTVVFQGNPNLEAETSETWNLGAIWAVGTNFNASIDFWSIDQENKIDEADVGFIYDQYCDPNNLNAQFCTRDPVTQELISVNSSYLNIGLQKASGIDLSLNYKMGLQEAGDLNFGLDLVFMSNFEKSGQDADGVSRLRDLTGEYEYPEYRWVASTEWEKDTWSVVGFLNYIGEFEDTPDADFDGSEDFHLQTTRTVDAMMTVDLQLNMDGGNLGQYTLGVLNLLDEEPPFAIGDGNSDLYGYVSNTHSPIGRFIYGKVSYDF